MKKTILYIAASIIGFGLMLTNCSKKADPAPAATTSTTGTTTTGTTTTSTTSGITTASTTSGSTNAGTTTTGTTTSSSTSGSTSAGSTTGTSGNAVGGFGTITVDGKTNTPTLLLTAFAAGTYFQTSFSNDNYVVSINFAGKDFVSGAYSIKGFAAGLPVGNNVMLTVKDKKTEVTYWANSGTVTVSGRTITFNNVIASEGNKSISVSGDYSFAK